MSSVVNEERQTYLRLELERQVREYCYLTFDSDRELVVSFWIGGEQQLSQITIKRLGNVYWVYVGQFPKSNFFGGDVLVEDRLKPLEDVFNQYWKLDKRRRLVIEVSIPPVNPLEKVRLLASRTRLQV